MAERQVGEDLGCAADDRGFGVDGSVPGQHADIARPELLAEVEELL